MLYSGPNSVVSAKRSQDASSIATERLFLNLSEQTFASCVLLDLDCGKGAIVGHDGEVHVHVEVTFLPSDFKIHRRAIRAEKSCTESDGGSHSLLDNADKLCFVFVQSFGCCQKGKVDDICRHTSKMRIGGDGREGDGSSICVVQPLLEGFDP